MAVARSIKYVQVEFITVRVTFSDAQREDVRVEDTSSWKHVNHKDSQWVLTWTSGTRWEYESCAIRLRAYIRSSCNQWRRRVDIVIAAQKIRVFLFPIRIRRPAWKKDKLFKYDKNPTRIVSAWLCSLAGWILRRAYQNSREWKTCGTCYCSIYFSFVLDH